jgi:hypothetical protein
VYNFFCKKGNLPKVTIFRTISTSSPYEISSNYPGDRFNRQQIILNPINNTKKYIFYSIEYRKIVPTANALYISPEEMLVYSLVNLPPSERLAALESEPYSHGYHKCSGWKVLAELLVVVVDKVVLPFLLETPLPEKVADRWEGSHIHLNY